MSSNKVILFNGPAGGGKTTCARALFELLGSCALLDVDSLITVEPFIWGNELSTLGLSNAAAVIANFFEAGFSQVIFSGGVFRQDLLDEFVRLLPSGTALHYFWIDAQTSVRHARCMRRARDGADAPEWIGTRDGLMPYPGPLEIPGGDYCEIDTTQLDPRQVARVVIDRFDEGALILRDR